MLVYLISYDLHKPIKDYPDLYTTIQDLGDWAHALDSVWFVDTSLELLQVNDLILKTVDKDDNYFVLPVTKLPIGHLSDTVLGWLNSNVG
jgi:hypothetical protein